MILLCMVLLAACAGKGGQKDDDQGLPYAQNAIRINLDASQNLNTFNNQPHTLVVVVYQLANPDAFKQLIDAPNGVAQLLEAEAFDGSVLSRRRVVIQPGENRPLYLDRAEGARYFGIVAGYFSRRAEDFSRVMPIVVRERSQFFWHGKDGEPADTVIRLELGQDRISAAEDL